MVLLSHITIALLGLVATGAAFVGPSITRIRVAYLLFCLTLVSGTYLVLSTHASLARACITGLAYTGVSLVGINLAQRKLAKTEAANNQQIQD